MSLQFVEKGVFVTGFGKVLKDRNKVWASEDTWPM